MACRHTATDSARRARIRHATLPALVLGAALTLAGCARDGGPGTATQATPSAAPAPQLVLDVLLRPSGPDAASTLLRDLPEPQATREQLHPNRHRPGAEDVYRTLTYPGLELTVITPGTGVPAFPVALDLTVPGQSVEGGLAVGMSADALRARLGPPHAVDGHAWRYAVLDDPAAAPYDLVATVVDGRVTRLRWIAYLD